LVEIHCTFKMEMEIIKSNKGQRKLLYEGYAYTKKSQNKSSIRWGCTKRIGFDCRGTVTTDLLVTVPKSTTEHTHDPDRFFTQALKLRSNIKDSAQTNRGKPGQIVTDMLSDHPKEVIVAAGSVNMLKQTVRRAKKVTGLKNPSTIRDIPVPLPDDFATNVIYDNESADSRILMFATEDGLRLLDSASRWFMDGTHSTAPAQFAQLFVIRVPLGNSCASVVYTLLPCKQQNAYEEMFSALLDACLQRDIRPNPEHIIADYEVAIHNAVRSILPDIHFQGCFYHLTQATWRKVQSEGLQCDYKNDDDVRTFCGKLDGLAFLPPDDVKEGMAMLKEQVPENLLGLVDYFDINYVNGPFRSVVTANGNIRFRRSPPRFPTTLWNVHHATMEDQDRTNNQCESWNNGFQHLVGHKNPSLWTLVKSVGKDAAMVAADILRCDRGEPPQKRVRNATKVHQRRLKCLCQQYVSGAKSLKDFMDAIGQFIRIK